MEVAATCPQVSRTRSVLQIYATRMRRSGKSFIGSLEADLELPDRRRYAQAAVAAACASLYAMDITK